MRENNWSEITQSITLSNATKTIQTYGLFVHGQHDVCAIHSTNENQRKAVIAIVRSVFGQQNGACMHEVGITQDEFQSHAVSKTNI